MPDTRYRFAQRSFILVSGLVALANISPAQAQSTAPSSVTPPSLRPAPDPGNLSAIIPHTQSLLPPPGAERLTVRLSAIAISGGLADLASQTNSITAKLVGRQVTLAELYAAASAIEALYARRGFVLSRVVVPPQELSNGGVFRITIIDGFVESVDVSAVPSNVRAVVARRVAALKGRRNLSLSAIEQPLLLAGDAPGLVLTSALARGSEVGGTSLVLSGRQSLLSGSVSVDNSLAPSLGRYGVTAQASLNSALGLGEQIYGFAASGYNVSRAFHSDAPVRVLGGGAVLPSADGRITINPEFTLSQTEPAPQAGAPRSRGKLRRFSLRGGFTIAKTRHRSLSASATFEQIKESNDAVDFGVPLSLDRFHVARFGASYSRVLARAGLAASAQLSQGLGGFGGVLPPGVSGSRQGATTNFTKANATLRLSTTLVSDVQLRLFGQGQTSFGQPLFRSEQAALEGPDALSAYIGGATAVDAALTARAEVERRFAVGGSRHALILLPYVFGAAGEGWIAQPTAVEDGHFALFNAGAGIRGAAGRTGFAIEYAHGFSATARFNRIDRISASTFVRF